MENTVTLILKPLEAEQFITFQKYYEVFIKLQESNALDIQFGKCVLNFAFGELQNIVKEVVVYKK